MISQMRRLRAPFYVQFELTESCNNRCFFCYNPLGHVVGKEMGTEKIKSVLKELSEAGVFRVNINGGEPTLRSDFKEIITYASELGFELHMNTNSTLVTEDLAKFISEHMRSICTSILHSKREEHDRMTGRIGAYDDVIRGIKIWRRNNVAVEINVCTTTENYTDIYNIGALANELDCYALCSTRYILNSPKNLHYLLNVGQTCELIDILLKVKEDFRNVVDVNLPGPVPFCELPEEYHAKLRQLNIPCQYGYGLVRISPTGAVTPCAISNEEIGSLMDDTFANIWADAKWNKYENLCHLPESCRVCETVSSCRGGCVVYDEAILNCHIEIPTRKWREFE